MTASMIPSLMIIGAICITIGYVFGWLIASMRGPKQNKAEDQTKQIEPSETPPSLLKISRDSLSGGLFLILMGKEIRSAQQLTLEERKQIAQLLQETASWLGIPTPSVPSVPIAVDPVKGMVPPVEPARPSVLGGVTSAIADVINPVPAKKEGPKSIVQQIDEILQDKLLGTPLENQKVFLVEDSRTGVIVRVGNETYAGIGALPEGEIKNLLKACVQEWERRQEIAKRHAAETK